MQRLILPIVIGCLLVAMSGVAPIVAQGSAPPATNVQASNSNVSGDVIVTWNGVPEASHYTVGYVNMTTDLPVAMANGDWRQAFRSVSVQNDGQSSHALRNLERGAHYAITIGTRSSVQGALTWPSDPVWTYVRVTDHSGSIQAPVSTSRPLTSAELMRRVKPALGYISYEITETNPFTGEDEEYLVSGSGFVVRSDGLMVTNRHVVEDQETVRVQMQTLNGDLLEFTAEVLGTGITTDLAVIKVNSNHNFNTLPLGSSDAVSPLDPVTAWGYPAGLYLGNYPTVTEGTISSRNRVYEDNDYLQTSAPISPGNSGGPLIDQYGQVIGVNTAKIVGVGFEGLGLAVASNEVSQRLGELESGGPDSETYRNLNLGHGYSVTIPRGWYLGGEHLRATDAESEDDGAWRLEARTIQDCTAFATYDGEADAAICSNDIRRLEDDLPEVTDTLAAYAEYRWNQIQETAAEYGFFLQPVAFGPVRIGGTRLYQLEYRLQLPPQVDPTACVEHRIMLVGLSHSYPENPFGFTWRVGVCERSRHDYDAEREQMLNSFRP